jgi:hypothetical protein
VRQYGSSNVGFGTSAEENARFLNKKEREVEDGKWNADFHLPVL